MSQTSHISTSGGLISTAFIENIRQARTNQRGTQPDTFGLPWQEAPKSPAALEARIAETWEALLERWDAIATELPKMDISQARDRWILPLLRALDFQPIYQRSDIVLELLAKEKDLERRLAQILTLRYADRSKDVIDRLVELLDDRNEEIRIAAACALQELRPREALPKLKRMIDELRPQQGMLFLLSVVGKYQTKEAAEILAAFLAAALEDAEKEKHLYNALSAFDAATGQRFGQSSGTYPQKAKEALAWWKSQRGE